MGNKPPAPIKCNRNILLFGGDASRSPNIEIQKCTNLRDIQQDGFRPGLCRSISEFIREEQEKKGKIKFYFNEIEEEEGEGDRGFITSIQVPVPTVENGPTLSSEEQFKTEYIMPELDKEAYVLELSVDDKSNYIKVLKYYQNKEGVKEEINKITIGLVKDVNQSLLSNIDLTYLIENYDENLTTTALVSKIEEENWKIYSPQYLIDSIIKKELQNILYSTIKYMDQTEGENSKKECAWDSLPYLGTHSVRFWEKWNEKEEESKKIDGSTLFDKWTQNYNGNTVIEPTPFGDWINSSTYRHRRQKNFFKFLISILMNTNKLQLLYKLQEYIDFIKNAYEINSDNCPDFGPNIDKKKWNSKCKDKVSWDNEWINYTKTKLELDENMSKTNGWWKTGSKWNKKCREESEWNDQWTAKAKKELEEDNMSKTNEWWKTDSKWNEQCREKIEWDQNWADKAQTNLDAEFTDKWWDSGSQWTEKCREKIEWNQDWADKAQTDLDEKLTDKWWNSDSKWNKQCREKAQWNKDWSDKAKKEIKKSQWDTNTWKEKCLNNIDSINLSDEEWTTKYINEVGVTEVFYPKILKYIQEQQTLNRTKDWENWIKILRTMDNESLENYIKDSELRPRIEQLLDKNEKTQKDIRELNTKLKTALDLNKLYHNYDFKNKTIISDVTKKNKSQKQEIKSNSELKDKMMSVINKTKTQINTKYKSKKVLIGAIITITIIAIILIILLLKKFNIIE